MNNTKIIILLLFFFGSTAVFGQKAQFKKADKAYKAKNYSEAIPLYEEGLAIKDNLSRKTKLANSYRMINQLEKAANIFREVVRDPKAKPITYFYLGESLMGAGNYDEAKYWFQQYHTKVPDDQQALLMIAACNQVKDVKSVFPDMAVIPFTHNSEVDDNAPIFWNNQILFSSDRNQGIKLLKQKSGVTGRDYIQVYSSSEEKNFNYSDPKSYSGKVNELNKNSSNITISHDGTRAVFSRNSKNANKKNTHTIQLFQMESTDGKKWKNIKEVDFANNAYNFMHPALSPDGKTLFFVSDKGSGQGGTDIYVSYYKKGKWSRPINLGPVINTEANEGFPFFDRDGKLFFCSKGHAGFGGFDIFFSTQDTETEQWDVPINVGAPVNSPADDISIFIDHESRRGLFTSSRDGGDDDIYLCWLDGLPDGLKLKQTEIVEADVDPQPEIVETTIETETIDLVVTNNEAEKVVSTPAPVETVIEILKEPTINETVIEVETVDPIVISSEVETVTLPSTQVETPVDVTIEQPTEIVEIEKEVELEVETPQEKISTPKTVETLSEIETEEMDLPTTETVKPVQVAIEEKIEIVPNTQSSVETDKITTPEKTIETKVEISAPTHMPVTETSVIPSTETAESVIKKEVEKEMPVIEKPAPNPSTIPTSKPTVEELPTPTTPSVPSAEDEPKADLSSATTITSRSSFSTLKKDLKKKRSTAGKVYRLKNIGYDPGGYLVEKAHGDALNEVHKLMEKNKAVIIELGSHTYSVGHDQTNLKLSQNRAKRAANYLIDKGIDPERIFAVGYGEEQILNRCTNGVACTQAEHAENERLEVRIMDEAH